MIYDPDAERPLYLEVTTARVNDITAAKAMPIEPGATYVFDLGYYDYGWWAKLDGMGCRIVTRLKKNTPLAVIAEQPLPTGSALLYDRIGHLPERLTTTRKNPFADPVREIGVQLEDGKALRVVTNDLDAPAQEIATSTSAAGPSNSSSDGSSRPSGSPTSSAAPRTPCASRSPPP